MYQAKYFKYLFLLISIFSGCMSGEKLEMNLDLEETVYTQEKMEFYKKIVRENADDFFNTNKKLVCV